MNGILQNRFSGAPIQSDSMHVMQSEAALVMQNGILQNRFSGATIQGDSMHGMQSEVTHKVTHNHNSLRWGTKTLQHKSDPQSDPQP